MNLRADSYSISHLADDDPTRRYTAVQIWRVGNGDNWLVGEQSSPHKVYATDGTFEYGGRSADYALPLADAHLLAVAIVTARRAAVDGIVLGDTIARNYRYARSGS